MQTFLRPFRKFHSQWYPNMCVQVWIITEYQLIQQSLGVVYILIDLDHILKPIVSLLTIKTTT